MKKSLFWICGFLAFVCFLISGYSLISHYQYPRLLKELTPFYSILKDQGNHSFHGKFKAEYSESHYVGIIFPKIITDLELKKQVENWNNIPLNVNEQIPGPDFFWQIVYKKKVIGNGEGKKGVTGWIGGTLKFGEFEAKSGRIYEIHVFFGPKFEQFLKYSPKIEIGVARAAVGVELEWSKDLNIPISIVFAILGIIFLIFALAYYWRLSKMKLKEKTKQ